jgi:putative methyltransferase (TIGR04325 family)
MKALSYAKWLVKAVTPPILLLGAKWIAIGLGVRKREEQEQSSGRSSGLSLEFEASPEWEYVPEGWTREVKGWAVEPVARAYRDKWPAYLAAIEAPSPLGVQHETAEVTRDDAGAHNMLVSFAYVLALAARGRGGISVLDWGGGLGHYYALARSVIPGLELDYHVKETSAVCAQGREVVPQVTFHEDETCLGRRYDLVLASSSLQYEQDWQSLLDRLAGAAEHYLYVARLPVALKSDSFVVLQRAAAYGYETEYLGWVVSRPELLERAAAYGLGFAREFLLEASFWADGAPENPVEHRSFLFNR